MVATVLIVDNQGGNHPTVPTANEVALQAPADPGPDPFTPSVETQGVSAPAPASAVPTPVPTPAPTVTPTAQHPGGASSRSGSPTALHSVEGSSAGLYAGSMGKPSCDTERLVGMLSTGDTGRAWASAAGIAQADVPGYLRSLTSAYLRVDTRVTNHTYKSGAVVEYQSALQAGTAVLVDAQGVPRVRCSCGNPLKPPALVSNARYTGKAWAGFQPSTLIIVVPAARPVTEIILVNVETGGWFSRMTGRVEVVDRPAEPPKGPLVPGIPPPGPWTPSTSSATSSTSPGTTSPGTTSPGATSPGTTPPGTPSPGTPTSSGATPSGSTGAGVTSSGPTTPGTTSPTSSGQPPGTATTTSTPPPSTVTTGTPTQTQTQTPTPVTRTPSPATTTTTAATTAIGTTTATTTTAQAPTATCASTAPSTLPPCPTASTATPS
ncbi:DUF6777 domain-containing protein [Kitasatospora xanthocidica]|uniref:DUF6777 domain-containing protein n=1 Tax=Kitasatospora xanthocidica TaxID=83382 RepID=UPI0011C490F4|nr:DUF6777 domain-containing protein [Kitasatospora xanthocidica]